MSGWPTSNAADGAATGDEANIGGGAGFWWQQSAQPSAAASSSGGGAVANLFGAIEEQQQREQSVGNVAVGGGGFYYGGYGEAFGGGGGAWGSGGGAVSSPFDNIPSAAPISPSDVGGIGSPFSPSADGGAAAVNGGHDDSAAAALLLDAFIPPPPSSLFDVAVVEDYQSHRRARYKDSNDDIGLYYDAEDLQLAETVGTYKVLVAVPIDSQGNAIPKELLNGGRAVRGGGTLSVQQARRRQQREAEAVPMPQAPPMPLASNNRSAGNPLSPLASVNANPSRGSNRGANPDDAAPSAAAAAAVPTTAGRQLGVGGGNTARLMLAREAAANEDNLMAGAAAQGEGVEGAATADNVARIELNDDGRYTDGRYATRYEWRGGRTRGRAAPFSPREGDGAPQNDADGGDGGGGPQQNPNTNWGWHTTARVPMDGNAVPNGSTLSSDRTQTAANDEAALRRMLYRTCDTHWFTFSGEPSDVLAFRSLIANDIYKDPPPMNKRPKRRLGPLAKGEVARGRRIAMNSPFPAEVLAMILLFIPPTNRRHIVNISSVCQQWRYYANYAPHWTRLRMNSFVGGYPKPIQAMLRQRKIVTRNELMLERSRAKKSAVSFTASRKRSVYWKELAVFLLILTLLLAAWAFAIMLPALATSTLNTDGKIGSTLFFTFLVFTIGEYFLFFWWIDARYFADPDVIAGVGQENMREIMTFRAHNDALQEESAREAQRAVREAARAQVAGMEARAVGTDYHNPPNRATAAERGRRLGMGPSSPSSSSAAARNVNGNGPSQTASSNTRGGGGSTLLQRQQHHQQHVRAGGPSRLLGGVAYNNGRRVAPGASTANGDATTVMDSSTTALTTAVAVGSPRTPMSPSSLNTAAPGESTSRRRGGAGRIVGDDVVRGTGQRPTLTAKAFFAESSRTIRTVPWLLFVFNLTGTVAIGLLWGRIRSVDGLIEMGELALVPSGADDGMWGGEFFNVGGEPSLPEERRAYYSLPAPLTDPRWLVVNPLLFFNSSSGGDAFMPIVSYNYSSSSSDSMGGNFDDPQQQRERWHVNRTDFTRLFPSCRDGGADSWSSPVSCFLILWFDADMQSPQFGGGGGTSDGTAVSFDALASALIPSWWNDTFVPCLANSTLCEVNATTGYVEGSSLHRATSGPISVATMNALLLKTVTSDWLGFNPYGLAMLTTEGAGDADDRAGGDFVISGTCPLTSRSASAKAFYDLANSTFVAIADGMHAFLDDVLVPSAGTDPYALLAEQMAFGAEERRRRSEATTTVGGGAATTSASPPPSPAAVGYASVVMANYYDTETVGGEASGWYAPLHALSTGSITPHNDDGGGGSNGTAAAASVYQLSGRSAASDGGGATVAVKWGNAVAPPYTAFGHCSRSNASSASSAPSVPFIPLIRHDIQQSLQFAKDRRGRLVLGHALVPIIFIVAAVLVFVLAVFALHPSMVDGLARVVTVLLAVFVFNPVILVGFGGVCIAQSVSTYSWSNDPPPTGSAGSPYEAPFMCDKVAGGGMVAVGSLMIIAFLLIYVKKRCQEM